MVFLVRRSGVIVNQLLRRAAAGYRPNVVASGKHFHTSNLLEKRILFNLSDIGEGIREVTVKEWFVKVGDTVEQFDNLCEVQSDKASVTITSRYDGTITHIHHAIDDVALVGSPLLEFEVEDEADAAGSPAPSDTPSSEEVINTESSNTTAATTTSAETKVLTTPAVRRIAMENKVDLSKVRATGPQGRLLKGDVIAYLNGTSQPVEQAPTKHTPHTPAAPATPAPAADRVEVLKGVRKIMFKSMTKSLTIPHFAYSDEIDMSKLVAARDELKAEALARGVKLSYMPFLIKAASNALNKYPILNSTLDVENESIHFKEAHNISVAVATEEGLVVPNIKNCHTKSVFEIARDLNNLTERAIRGQLQPNDFANGTFSLSNIGTIGGTYTLPCIMSPQVAIGALGKTRVVPKFGPNGEIVRAHVMNVSWAADHRVIDGVTIARFSELWRKYLENPNLFLLDGH